MKKLPKMANCPEAIMNTKIASWAEEARDTEKGKAWLCQDCCEPAETHSIHSRWPDGTRHERFTGEQTNE